MLVLYINVEWKHIKINNYLQPTQLLFLRLLYSSLLVSRNEQQLALVISILSRIFYTLLAIPRQFLLTNALFLVYNTIAEIFISVNSLITII